MDIAIIADEDTVLGFKLAGVKNATVYKEDNAKEAVNEYKNAKIVIVTEKVAAKLKEQELLDNMHGVVAEIPDKSGSTGAALENISTMLEEAIGVKLKS
ncbi:MAG: hypothetical protein OXR66_04010 [Candidatus Woesearchaeota archaeon]|nr:hypothetical protein [Candidatus Woesearchaeota archaeon]